MAFIFFRFCGQIVNRDAFTALCFMLRATSAIGGAAAETSALTILLEKFPDNVGMVSVCGISFLEFKLCYLIYTLLALKCEYYIVTCMVMMYFKGLIKMNFELVYKNICITKIWSYYMVLWWTCFAKYLRLLYKLPGKRHHSGATV